MNKILFAPGAFLVKTGNLLTLISSYQAKEDPNVTYFMKEVDKESFPETYKFLDKYLSNSSEVAIDSDFLKTLDSTVEKNTFKKFEGKNIKYIRLSEKTVGKEHFVSSEDMISQNLVEDYKKNNPIDFKNNGNKVPLWFAQTDTNHNRNGCNIANLDISNFDFYKSNFTNTLFNNAFYKNKDNNIIIKNKAQFIEYLLDNSYKKEVELYNATYKPTNKDQTIDYFTKTLFNQVDFMVITS